MDEKLKRDIEGVVAGIFSEKEEQEMRKRTEEALSEAATTIENLTETLEEKNAELDGMKETVSTKEAEIDSLTTKIDEQKSEMDKLQEALAEKEATLEEMHKTKKAEDRMKVLSEEKVAHSNEAEQEKQFAKVKEMSDEDFETYKEELVSLRKAVVAEIDLNRPQSEEENVSEEKAEENSEEAEEQEDDETVDPANVDPEKAESAAVNLESDDDSVIKKYEELGKEMASRMINRK
jgi:chromosome segregation ATPase